MRRIILALLAVTLTACDGGMPEPPRDSAPSYPASTAETGDGDGALSTAPPDAARTADVPTVLFVGTSLTAGYGVGAEFAYPAVLQQMMDSAGLAYRVVNAGISGETSAGGLRRIDWSLQQPAAVLVLELGANDALRGLDTDEMRNNLDAILRRARELHPGIDIVIIGMEAPPNLGDDYGRRFRTVYTDLAREYDAALVPFLLEGVAAVPALNLEDGIHPNSEGQRILAHTVWQELELVLRR